MILKRGFLPIYRAAQMVPSTIDVAKRTVDVIFSTGVGTQEFDYYSWESYLQILSLDPAHCDLSILNSGKAPLLDSHNRYSSADTIGRVIRAWLVPGEARATVWFSEVEPLAEQIFQKVIEGSVNAVSLGGRIRKFQITKKEGQLDEWLAVDWYAYELSFCPIGKDGGAGVVRSDQGVELYRADFGDMTLCEWENAMPPEDNKKEASEKNLQAKLKELTGQDSEEAQFGVLRAMKHSHERVPELLSTRAAAEVSQTADATTKATDAKTKARAEVVMAVDAAIREFRASASERDVLLASGGVDGERIEGLRAELAARHPILRTYAAPSNLNATPGAQVTMPEPAVMLSAEEREVSRRLGLEEDETAKEKARQRKVQAR